MAYNTISGISFYQSGRKLTAMAVPEAAEGDVTGEKRHEVAEPGQDREVGSLCETPLAVGVLDQLDGRGRDLAPESRLAVVSYVARWKLTAAQVLSRRQSRGS